MLDPLKVAMVLKFQCKFCSAFHTQAVTDKMWLYRLFVLWLFCQQEPIILSQKVNGSLNPPAWVGQS